MTSYIFTGSWINYDRNSVLGATLTLSQRDANFLTAFLGIFIVFVGGAFWTIFAFLLYNIIDRDGNVDVLRRQHQVILRNSEDALGAWWQLIELPLAWKKKYFSGARGRNHIHPLWKYTLRSLTLAIWGLVVFSAWTVAGIFSSEASTSAGTETLIRSDDCGTWTFPVSNTSIVGFSSKLLSDSNLAASYVDRCYGPNATSLLCETFVKQAIPFSNKTDASCPFAAGWCWFNDSAALELDTGFIDSHQDLGINAPPGDRIKYRRVTTCSVIPENLNYINTTNSSTGVISRYWYGPMQGARGTNWTFQYNHVESTLPIGYELNAVSAQIGSEPVTWVPIQQLNTTQVTGDITLIYLAPNSIQYTEPINDPFYGAHRQSLPVSIDGLDFAFYSSDYGVHVIGCIDQHQFCNPNRWNDPHIANCTISTGAIPIANTLDKIGYNPRQLATAYRIQHILFHSGSIDSSISGRGNSALQANKLVYSDLGASLQNALPDNQWVFEITNWFNVGLAQLQRAVVEFAAGPVNLPPEAQVITPTDEGWPIMCKRQKVYNPGGYQNFSILALSIIIGVGAIIIFLSLTLEPCINHFRKRRAPLKRLRWGLDNKLQLQRMAYQYIGMGKWEKKDMEVPVMVPMDDKIFVLPENIDYRNPGLSKHHDIRNLEDGNVF